MRSFPFDNANEADTSQCVSSDILADYYHEMNGKNSGIYSELGSKGLVVAGGGMTVKVMPVNGIIKGRLFKEENERALTIDPSEAQDRIDSVVIRQNKATPITDLYVIKGASGAVPVAPTPVRSGDIHDLVIAHLFVAKSTTEIPQSKITDTRTNKSLCGLVAVPTQVDTTSIFNQFQGALDEYLILVENAIDGTMAGHLQGQITSVKTTATTAQNKANAAVPKAEYESHNKYSTVEHWTGKYFVDGKKVYRKTLIATVNQKVMWFATGVSVDNVVSVDAFLRSTGVQGDVPVPYAYQGGFVETIFSKALGWLYRTNDIAYAAGTFVITFEYTEKQT